MSHRRVSTPQKLLLVQSESDLLQNRYIEGSLLRRVLERERGGEMQTIRRQIIELLSESECNARDLSQMLRIREKEVYDHLGHIALSVSAQKQKLAVKPARCLECGYTFEDRKRFTKPSRCPRCRGEHLEDPKYRIV